MSTASSNSAGRAAGQQTVSYNLLNKGYILPADAYVTRENQHPPLESLPGVVRKIVAREEIYGKGQTGLVRPVISLNGDIPSTPLVIKDFTELDRNQLVHNWWCTQMLIQRRYEIRRAFEMAGLPRIGFDPYLMGVPIFLWAGPITDLHTGKERIAYGHASVDLKRRGYVELASFYSDHDSSYRDRLLHISARRRVYMAIHLAGLLRAFSNLNPVFVNGDVQPNNIMIRDADDGELALIDYDDGVFLTRPNSATRTVGNPEFSEWRDPIVVHHEIFEFGPPPNLQEYADWWALAVTTHFLIFGRLPYFFLDIPADEYANYAKSRLWPHVNPKYPISDTAEYAEYTAELEALKQTTPTLYDLFVRVFNQGRGDKYERPHPKKWVDALRLYYRSLLSKPAILYHVERFVLAEEEPRNLLDELLPLKLSLPLELTRARIEFQVEHTEDVAASTVELWKLAGPPLRMPSGEWPATIPVPAPEQKDERQDQRRVNKTSPRDVFHEVIPSDSGWFALVVRSAAEPTAVPVGPFVAQRVPNVTGPEMRYDKTSRVVTIPIPSYEPGVSVRFATISPVSAPTVPKAITKPPEAQVETPLMHPFIMRPVLRLPRLPGILRPFIQPPRPQLPHIVFSPITRNRVSGALLPLRMDYLRLRMRRAQQRARDIYIKRFGQSQN